MEEAAGSGHQWQIDALRDAGFAVLSDKSAFARDPLHYGALAIRTLIARPPEHGLGQVTLREISLGPATIPPIRRSRSR